MKNNQSMASMIGRRVGRQVLAAVVMASLAVGAYSAQADVAYLTGAGQGYASATGYRSVPQGTIMTITRHTSRWYSAPTKAWATIRHMLASFHTTMIAYIRKDTPCI